jgi:hypothetical protein
MRWEGEGLGFGHFQDVIEVFFAGSFDGIGAIIV